MPATTTTFSTSRSPDLAADEDFDANRRASLQGVAAVSNYVTIESALRGHLSSAHPSRAGAAIVSLHKRETSFDSRSGLGW